MSHFFPATAEPWVRHRGRIRVFEVREVVVDGVYLPREYPCSVCGDTILETEFVTHGPRTAGGRCCSAECCTAWMRRRTGEGDGPLSLPEAVARFTTRGVSMKKMAPWFGVSDRTIKRWSSGQA